MCRRPGLNSGWKRNSARRPEQGYPEYFDWSSAALPIGLFILLPSFLGGFVPKTWGVLARNVLEGCVRVVLFLLFMWSVSHMKDIRRTFEYHGAEHKTIFCYENEEPLTVENVKKHSRFHPAAAPAL